MKNIMLATVICVFLCGCDSMPRLFNKISFEDNKQIINIYGNMYGDIIIQNPDGNDQYRNFLKPRTIFVETDKIDQDEIDRNSKLQYDNSRKLSTVIGSYPQSTNKSSSTVNYSSSSKVTNVSEKKSCAPKTVGSLGRFNLVQ